MLAGEASAARSSAAQRSSSRSVSVIDSRPGLRPSTSMEWRMFSGGVAYARFASRLSCFTPLR